MDCLQYGRQNQREHHSTPGSVSLQVHGQVRKLHVQERPSRVGLGRHRTVWLDCPEHEGRAHLLLPLRPALIGAWPQSALHRSQRHAAPGADFVKNCLGDANKRKHGVSSLAVHMQSDRSLPQGGCSCEPGFFADDERSFAVQQRQE